MARDVNLPQCSWRLCSPIHFLRFQEQHEYDHLKCIKQKTSMLRQLNMMLKK